ncbi:MAG: TRAP transporter substrate-binding protein [Paracoccaceae bacterium]|jgi:TRAP-type C4-dicarboxylate transport system substrate-binding protein
MIKTTRRNMFKAAALLGVIGLAAGPAVAQKKLVLGTIQGPTAPLTLAAEHFGSELERLTDGRFKVNVVSAAQLGPALEQYQNVQSGAQDLFVDDIGWNAQFVRDYGVLAVPFAINGQEGFRKVLGSDFAESWRAELRSQHGIETLSDTFIRSPRVVFTTSAVYSPDDLSGVKFRVPEIDVYFNSWKAIGVNPTPVPWGELYLALRQGVVDGGEGPFTTLIPTKFPEVAKNVLLTNHLYSSNTMIMNGASYDALSDADKALFAEATESAEKFFLKEIAKLEAEHQGTMETEYGVTFAKPSDTQRAAFAAKVSEAVPGFVESGLFSEGIYEKVIAAQ